MEIWINPSYAGLILLGVIGLSFWAGMVAANQINMNKKG